MPIFGVPVFGVPVFGMALSSLAAEAVVARVLQPPPALQLLVTPNLEHLRLLRRPAFRAAYAYAALICADGWPIALYARLRRSGSFRRVTGCEIYRRLAAHPELKSQRVFVVTEGLITAAVLRQWADAQGLTLRAAVAPPGLLPNHEAQLELAADIRDWRPTILVMALGAPASEIFVEQNRTALPPCWALCVGQAVRVQLGLVPRAPIAAQSLGLEWLWRLAREPRRLARRYAAAAAWFPVAVVADLLGLTPPLAPAGRGTRPAPAARSPRPIPAP